MRAFIFGIGLFTFCIQALAVQPHLSTVIDCELEGPKNTISLLRGSPIVDTYIYKVRHAQKASFMYEDAEASRGGNVKWQCASDQQNLNVLVVSGEFSSNFLQGVLFYFDSGDGHIERINFAERNRPRWVRISAQGAQVIFENTCNESSHKYLSYGRNGAFLELDELPVISSSDGDRLIELDTSKP
ncbi:hypothetical protein [Pseudomonas sp.]|uniref:hypothetical protein n=1 Tax=Pseudomonas sp. TaxID=306 RepID=UPI003F3DFC0B